MDDHKLLSHLEFGNRLQKPLSCRDNLYRLMTACWNSAPENRPTFANLVNMTSTLRVEGTDAPVTGASFEPIEAKLDQAATFHGDWDKNTYETAGEPSKYELIQMPIRGEYEVPTSHYYDLVRETPIENETYDGSTGGYMVPVPTSSRHMTLRLDDEDDDI